jgi:hypothetical protein
LRASRTPTQSDRPGRSARRGKPSPQDQETAAVLCEQLAFGDVAGDAGQDQDQDQDDNQEQEFVISPERRAWLEELRRRVGDLAREDPKANPKKKRRGGTGVNPSHRPGYRLRR